MRVVGAKAVRWNENDLSLLPSGNEDEFCILVKIHFLARTEQPPHAAISPTWFDWFGTTFVTTIMQYALREAGLRAAGKPHKVVVTAVVRKLVTIASALCKSRQNSAPPAA